MIRIILLILGPVCVIFFIAGVACAFAFQLQQIGGIGPQSSIAAAALSLQGHITGARSNQYDTHDPFMKPVLDYWAKSCPGSGTDGICALAESGNLQCVEFVTAAFFLAGDPLPVAPNAEQFWDTYGAFASWEQIPSPSAFPTVPKQAPHLGDLMVFRGGAHLENGHLVEFGHIGVVVGFDAPSALHDGSIEIAEANGPGTKFPPQSTNPFIASDKAGNTYLMTVHPDYRIDTWGPYTQGGVAYSGMTVLGFLHHNLPPQARAVRQQTERTPFMLLTPILDQISIRGVAGIVNSPFALRLLSLYVVVPSDSTGVNDAMLAIARLIAGFVGGAVAISLVIEGYQYMFSDSASRGVHLKRAFAILIGGAILIILGVSLAPTIVTAISTGK